MFSSLDSSQSGDSDDPAERRRRLGLPEKKTFREEPPPRPVNWEQLRALHRGKLSYEEREEVVRLIVNYREWYEADAKLVSEEGGTDDGIGGDQ